MSETFVQGLQLMGYGLVGVFVTLGLFMVSIVALTKAFPYKEENEEQSS